MSVVGRRVAVRVPATSANLGPGFDTLGLALSMYDELTVTATDRPEVTVAVTGVGAGEVALDETNLVASSALATFAAVRQEAPGMHIEAHNSIPHGRGLGSSGAAVVAGIAAAKGLLEGTVSFTEDLLLGIASELEGHPDNVAPALFGGLTIAWTGADGPRHKKLMPHRGVSPLVFIPESTLSTRRARELQPINVPHADAVFNVSRSALLVAAMLQSPELLFHATEDKLHQSYRSSAMPETADTIALLRAHGYPAVVSGAGPSILVLCDGPGDRLEAARLVQGEAAIPWRAEMLAVDFKGATVVPIP
ncbi:homoserine kinase [Paramicrobacterium agarici]|uniref:Homoserine kinase n=1 Tax=Paramicrobacterium agarici TaxID=630514 RepID=A0A2A9DYA4_9MICO|nr:homoserine kinase [Microbacterium agarici]PFG30920.1 homoserine kinase [Microbacterium agarici]TQO23986.1 homoserine kinase [Microbacterium agarici]